MAAVLGSFVVEALASLFSSSRRDRENREEAQRNRDFQADMSNTAYQRSVADMQKAGLNPMMMYGGIGGGASTPSGAMAQPTDYSSYISTAVQATRAFEEIKNLRAIRQNVEADTSKKFSESDLAEAQRYLVLDQQGQTRANTALVQANLPEAAATAEVYKGPYGELLKAVEKVMETVGIGRRAISPKGITIQR